MPSPDRHRRAALLLGPDTSPLRHTSRHHRQRIPAVGAIEYGISRLSTFISVMALVAGEALVAWVIGLLIVLRGSEPDERSEIIQAYAHCNPLVYLRNPLVYLRRNTVPGGEGWTLARANGGTADSGGETDHEESAWHSRPLRRKSAFRRVRTL